MTTSTLVDSTPVTSNQSPILISESDPRLQEIIVLDTWRPPVPWDQLDLTPDQRLWVDHLVSLDLLPKSTSAVTCGKFFRKILEYQDHWVRAGRTTCHLMSCRNCGQGKMRIHRMHMTDPERLAHITSVYTDTYRLTVRHETACGIASDYAARVSADRRYMRLLWRAIRRKFTGKGVIRSVELDPKMKDVTFRIYIASDDGTGIRFAWIAKQWQRIVGQQGLADTAPYTKDGKDALKWTLDSLIPFLMLPGDTRAYWEKAFDSLQLISSVGILRGAQLDSLADDCQLYDAEAPFGYCPCGCGGKVVKCDHHAPMTGQQLADCYDRVDYGPLRDYVAYRPKVKTLPVVTCQVLPTTLSVDPSPPPL